MKKFIFIFSVYILCYELGAQSFSVGNTCCNYNFINKTFTLISTPCSTISPNFYGFDVDGDAVEDIRITSFNSPPCFAGGVQSKGIMMTSATNCEVAYSTALTCPYRYLMNLPFGTPLDASLNWSVTPASWTIGQPSPYLYFEYINPSSFSYTCSTQASVFYAGFRKILANDTIYGWVLMDTNMPGKLFSYAHTNIPLGVKSISNSSEQFVIYPNPSPGEFNIRGMKEIQINVTNELGQLVKTIDLNSKNNFTSQVSDLQSGIYFIGNNSVRQKVIVIK